MKSDHLRFGILGTARIAESVVPRMQATSIASVTAVASRSQARAKDFAERHGIPIALEGYDQLIACPDVDAVYIPLPPSMHRDWTIRAAAAGKHVLCEKPLGCNAHQVDEMISTCQQNNVVLLDGVMWYHTARAQRLVEIARSSELGEIRQINSVFTFSGDQLAADNLQWNQELGGGALLDLGWYCVGATLLIKQCLPIRVSAFAKFRGDVDERMNGLMQFEDGSMASFECGFDTVRRRWIEIAGTNASLVCSDFTKPWNPDQPTLRIVDGNGKGSTQVIPHPLQEECMIDAFCKLAAEGTTEHAWLKLSRDTQYVCDLLANAAT
ncbi:MAG: Gfo/Idh/MocA family oxidoreductase [Planctomycetaceae bacterium]